MTREAPLDASKARDDAASWATPTGVLSVGDMPAGAVNRNVAGRRLVGPVQGFGQLWQKTYRIRLERDALTPAEVISEWKANYASYWPKGNRFYAPSAGIQPGGVALINATSLGGVQLSTGIEVIYADDESFAFMNAEGHPAAGMITFSAEAAENGVWAQVQVLIRANDPMYDLMLPLYGHRAEDQIWTKTLGALGAHFGASGDVTVERLCVDRHRNWSQAKNIWRNAAIRSGLYMAGAPIRWVRRRIHNAS
ncbi:MAG: DUF1990 family protein [Chloroflexota bacterium]|nr:DUF1990 family protein [Chloroflexota bacterium]